MSASFAASAAEFGGQIIPGNAGLEYEEDAGEDHAIVERLTTRVTCSSWRMRRQQRLNTLPKGVGYERFHDRAPFP
jgi:hypothetical protein